MLECNAFEAKVREIATAMRAAIRAASARNTPTYSDVAFLADMALATRDLEDLLSTPLPKMLADMTEEWGVSYRHENEERTAWGFPTRAAAEKWEKENRRSGSDRGRIVRHYVTPMEEA